MNVLVYSGSETTPESVESTLDALRTVCLPNYTVQPLTKASFTKDPWEIACALFVLPPLTSSGNEGNGERDLNVFNPKQVEKLRAYIERGGGAFLGLGLGGRFDDSASTAMAGLDLGHGLAFGGEAYIKEEDRRVPLKFVDKASKTTLFPQLGTPSNAPAPGAATPVISTVGKGRVALATTIPTSPSPSNLASFHALLRTLLTSLHLQVPSAPTPPAELSPLPQFLVSMPAEAGANSKPIVTQLLQPFFQDTESARDFVKGRLEDTQDTFKFVGLKSDGIAGVLSGSNQEEEQQERKEKKEERCVFVCPDGVLPPKGQTPHFDVGVYFDTLRKLKKAQGASGDEGEHGWGFGEALFYGERVTSTQSMFDKNPTLLSTLPTPVLSIAAQQLAGRGRGRNVWLSPEGCLMMSLLVRVSLDPGVHKPGTPLKGTRTGAGKKATSEGKTAKMEGPSKTTKTESSGGPSKTTKTESSGVPSKTTKTEATGAPSKTTTTETTGAPSKTTKTETTGVPSKTTKTEITGAPSKTTKTETTGAPSKTTKTDSTISPKTTKTESTDSSHPKTTKTESSGLKSTKTSSTGDVSLKITSTAGDDDSGTQTTKTTATASNQLKTNPVGPDTKTTGSASGAKTTKTTSSGEQDSLKTSKTTCTDGPSTKSTSSSPPSTRPSAFTAPLLHRLASAFATPPAPSHPEPNPLPHLAASKLVFVQYLFALAVCQACRTPEVLGPELGARVRVKWPNDLYLDLGGGEGERVLKKIGGILVNTNFAPGQKVDVVIGCGLNVLNEPPIASLAQLITQLHPTTTPPLSLERTAAAIMTAFSSLWDQFTAASGSFEPFLEAYYDVWLHTDQRVTVTTTTPHIKARIVGITPDYGLLRTVREGGDEESAGWSGGRYVYGAREGGREYVDLQPDGNSFDLMANLIKAKTT